MGAVHAVDILLCVEVVNGIPIILLGAVLKNRGSIIGDILIAEGAVIGRFARLGRGRCCYHRCLIAAKIMGVRVDGIIRMISLSASGTGVVAGTGGNAGGLDLVL